MPVGGFCYQRRARLAFPPFPVFVLEQLQTPVSYKAQTEKVVYMLRLSPGNKSNHQDCQRHTAATEQQAGVLPGFIRVITRATADRELLLTVLSDW